MNDALIEQLILHESLRLKPYMDTVGKITIGVGRNLSDKGITKDEALVLLEHDLDEAVATCAEFPWFARLDTVRQRVLIDMAFNLGGEGLRKFKRTLRLIEAGDYDGAAKAMRNSLWARQTKSRADRLIRWMREGVA